MFKGIPTWEQLLSSASLDTSLGICGNIRRLAGGEAFDAFLLFLDESKYQPHYPIGINGFVYKTSSASRIDKARRTYYDGFNVNKFSGMQGALRHNLYKEFLAWYELNKHEFESND